LRVPAYAILSAANAKEWWEYKWIPEPSSGMVMLFLVIVLSLLVLLIAADILTARRQRAAVRRRRWELFKSITHMHGLAEAEIDFLKRFVKYQPEENPVAIVNSPAEYDACVEHELSWLARRKASESEIDETLDLISIIRRKLALDNLPQGQFLHSTRGLLPNQEIKVKAAGMGVEKEFDSVIVAVTEKEITITAPRLKEDVYHLDPGAGVGVSLVRRNDAIYNFESRVLRTFVGRTPLVTISHTNDLERIQLRRYYRVEVEAPVAFALLERHEISRDAVSRDEAIAAAILGARTTGRGTLKNISGGGALLESRSVLSVGDFLNFDLDLWGGAKENITGEVVSIVSPPETEGAEARRRRTTVHLTFVGMNDRLRDRIVKYVFRRQLDDIRKARERVDERAPETSNHKIPGDKHEA